MPLIPRLRTGEDVITIPTWNAVASFTWTSDATFTVADDAANQGIFTPGRPIRYCAAAGTWRYGIVTGYSSGAVTLAGAPLTTSDDEMEYGDPNRVAQVEFFIGGKFADSANTGLLASDAKTFFSWGLTQGYLVRIRHRVSTDDSGASQPRVTVSIGGSVVGTDNTNAGLPVAESWTSTTTGINVSNYDITLGEAMEVVTDANGTNDDAADLTVSCTFVLE